MTLREVDGHLVIEVVGYVRQAGDVVLITTRDHKAIKLALEYYRTQGFDLNWSEVMLYAYDPPSKSIYPIWLRREGRAWVIRTFRRYVKLGELRDGIR